MSLSWVLSVVLVALVTVVGMALWWRFAARRRALPCPSWLFWIEHPYAEIVAKGERLVALAGLSPGMAVLDVGAGSGRVSLPAAHAVLPDGVVTALDIQQQMLDLVGCRAREEGLENIVLQQGDVATAVLPDNHFNHIFLNAVLGELSREEQGIKNIFNALRPGGTLSITEMLPDPHYQTRRMVRKIERYGFSLVKERGNLITFTMIFRKPLQTGNGPQ